MKTYSNEHCTINLIHGDCMEMEGKYDLAIVDCEYGINQGGHTNGTRSKLAVSKSYKPFDDSKAPNKEYFTTLSKISDNQIIWGANHFINKIPFNSSCWIVWDKKNGQNDFADCELAWTNFDTAVRIFRFQWQGMIQGYGGNKSNNEVRIHPTQKPVALYKWLLKNYAKQGDTILDTHGGSMSIAIACYDMGFSLDLYEIDKDYYNDGVKRFEEHITKLQLFEPKEVYQYEQLELIE